MSLSRLLGWLFLLLGGPLLAQSDPALTRAQELLDTGYELRSAKLLDSAAHSFQALAEMPASGNPRLDSLRGLGAHLWGHTLTRIGKSRYEESKEPYRLAIEIRDALYPNGHNDRAKSRFNLGYVHARLGEFEAAEKWFQESDLLYGQLASPDTMRWLRVYDQLAINYREREDPQMTKSAVLRALPLIESYYRDAPFDLADFYYQHVTNLSSIGLEQLFEEKMRKALAFYTELNDPLGQGLTHEALATAAMERKDYETAIPGLQRSMQLLIEAEEEETRIASVKYNLAISHLELGDLAAASALIESAIESYLSAGIMPYLVEPYNLAANIYSKSGKRKLAEKNFLLGLEALGLAEPVVPDSVKANQLVELSGILEDRAVHYRRYGDLRLAERNFDLVFQLQDRIRLELDSEESRNYVSERVRPIYQWAIELAYERFKADNDPTQAFRALVLAERSKAFSLLIAVNEARGDRPRRERELERQIAKLERMNDPESINQLSLARLEFQRLKGLAKDKVTLPEPLNAEELVSFLAATQTNLLEYAQGEEKSYRISLTPTGKIGFEELAGKARLAELVNDFREAIRASAYKTVSLKDKQRALDHDFKVAGWTAFQEIIGSATNELALDNAGSGKLLIIPDGVLGFLPFGTLLTTDPGTPPYAYSELPYLVREAEISYSYSAAYLLELSEQEIALPAGNLLAFAPTFRGTSESSDYHTARAININMDKAADRSLPALMPLRFNQEEVEVVANLFSRSTAYLGEEAARDQFIAAAADHRILLISSHAFVNSRDPNLSFIAFSQRGDSLESSEMLFMNDLGTLDLPTQLAVLSACETSMGKVSPGEGVLSLARAFASAGAASTLTTLWKVDDEATKELSVSFFRNLKAGQSRSQAIRNAQLEAIASKDFMHPYYWSAMTLYGNPGKLELNGSIDLKWWMIGGVLVLILGFVAWRTIK